MQAGQPLASRDQPSGERVHHRIAGEPSASNREVGGRGAIQLREATDRVRILSQVPTPGEQRVQLLPPRFALVDEELMIHDEIVYRFPVELDDRLAITTPEGVALDLVVAGIGSRFLAGMLDVAIQIFTLMAIFQTLEFATSPNGFVTAGLIVVLFLVAFGYPVLFELFNHGRTPGKAAAGIRVVKTDGNPIGAAASLIRNLIRLIDGWNPFTVVLFPIGFVAAFCTRHCQRLGDLAAGTLVVRERLVGSARTNAGSYLTMPPPPGLNWDVVAVTAEEVFVIRRYLERRSTLPAHVRMHLGATLGHRIRTRIPGIEPSLFDEQLLEWTLARKEGRV